MGNVKKMQIELQDLEKELEDAKAQLQICEDDHDKYLKTYRLQYLGYRQNINRLQEKILKIKTENKLLTMHYTNGVFVYNGGSYVIKRERIESIFTTDRIHPSVQIDYKPIGTSKVSCIEIPCGDVEQMELVYQTVRKILLGV